MFKKTALVIVGSLLIVKAAFAATTIEWNCNLANNLYNSSDNALSLSGSYYVQLVIDANGSSSAYNTQFSQMTGGQVGLNSDSTPSTFGGVAPSASDDVVGNPAAWSSSTWIPYSGTGPGFYTSGKADVAGTTEYAGKPFYFRWFNTSDPATATEAGVIYCNDLSGSSGAAWTVPAANSTITVGFNYTDSNSNATGSKGPTGSPDGWATIAPVPEPGTIGLMLVGLVAVGVRRFFRK